MMTNNYEINANFELSRITNIENKTIINQNEDIDDFFDLYPIISCLIEQSWEYYLVYFEKPYEFTETKWGGEKMFIDNSV